MNSHRKYVHSAAFQVIVLVSGAARYWIEIAVEVFLESLIENESNVFDTAYFRDAYANIDFEFWTKIARYQNDRNKYLKVELTVWKMSPFFLISVPHTARKGCSRCNAVPPHAQYYCFRRY